MPTRRTCCATCATRSTARTSARGNLGALGQQYKDSVMNQYLQRKDAYNQMGLANIDAKAQSGENLMYNSMKSLGGIGSTYLKGIYGIDKGNLLGKKS